MNETLSISPRFFRTEMQNYSAPFLAFWRELIQNAVDAGSTNIAVTINGDTVSIQDNGCGMDESTLRNVYFRLGETGKDFAGSIGGFGKARILTCFAHKSYSIETGNIFCTGAGAAFSIDKTDNFVKGCCVTVEVDKCGHDVNLERELRNYLSYCQLQQTVTINGEKFTGWLHRRRLTRSLSFATVYVNKSQTTGMLFVRVMVRICLRDILVLTHR